MEEFAGIVWFRRRKKILARSESGQGTVVAAIEAIVKSVQGVELRSQFHAFAALSLDTAPVPLVIVCQVDIAQVYRFVAQIVLATLPSTRSRRQQAGAVQHDGGVNGKAADLEDVLAHGGGMNLLLPAAGGILVVSGPDAAEVGIQPLGRSGSALGHKVADDVEPLAVPASHPAPDLVGLVW